MENQPVKEWSRGEPVIVLAALFAIGYAAGHVRRGPRAAMASFEVVEIQKVEMGDLMREDRFLYGPWGRRA